MILFPLCDHKSKEIWKYMEENLRFGIFYKTKMH
jgi:hypothetical protein